ncbi:TlpA disulfide reductase family protein [Flavisolibacter nicotianae]|uniref:TlpA disulfide reductase family protein n=1 Tax=Flavisolibacter nicotianae TaxID=2364882 RepID=UPI00196971B6|nr:TlpA disulfide reductase family protein [Flavisolibacter nicotianae]
MKKLFVFLFVPALTFAQVKAGEKPVSSAQPQTATAKTADGFTISGNVQGLADGEVKITTTQGEQVLVKGAAKNGVFNLAGKVEEPGLYWLTMGKEQPQYIFLENTAIKISGKQSDIKNIQIEGSQSHKDFLQFRKAFDPLFANLNAISFQIQQAAEEKKPALMQQYTTAITNMNKAVGEFIRERPASYVSVFLLSITKQINENVSELEERFNALNPSLKSSTVGKDLEGYISFAKIGSVGSEAPEFIQADVNDKPISLSSFRGKYVLLDFWASWCKPCRQENPNVVKAFNKFKGKNFTVFSVSLDQQKESWVRAIAADKLDWTHVSDLKFWNNAAAELYHVQSIPQNFLIDPAGKIVAKDLRGEDLDKKLCELLGCN